MKALLFLSIGILLSPVSLPSQNTFQETFDLNSDDEFNAVIQTADGGTFAAGYSTGSPYGGIVVKTNAAGIIQWSKTAGGTKLYAAAQMPGGNYYVAGENTVSSNTNFYLAKLDANGAILWSRTYGTATEPDQLYSMSLTSNGGVILSGNADGTAGSGFLPIGFVIKVDSTGTLEWARTVSGGNGEIFYVAKEVTGGFLTCGYTGSFGSPVGTEAYMVKWDYSGNLLWERVFGHNNRFDRIFDFVEKPTGGFFLTGRALYTSTSDNMWMASTDQQGALIWHHNYSMYDGPARIMELSDGNLAVAGFYMDQNLGLYNQSYLIKTDTLGAVIWARQYGAGGAVDDRILCAVTTSDDGFLMSGSTYGTGVQRTSWIIRADSTGASTCRDSALTVSVTTLTIVVSPAGAAVTITTPGSPLAAGGQLNATYTVQYFCGGPNSAGSGAAGSGAAGQYAVTAYPMPAYDHLDIDADPAMFSEVTLYNSTGQVVSRKAVAASTTTIDVSSLAKGIYLLELTGETGRYSKSIMID